MVGWRAIASLVTVLTLGAAVTCVTSATSAPPIKPTATTAERQLKQEQARVQLEIAEAQRDHLRQQTKSARSADAAWRALLPLAIGLLGTFATVMLALLAIVVPMWIQRGKDRQAREEASKADIEQRATAAQADLAQRTREDQTRKEAAQAEVERRTERMRKVAMQRERELIQRFDVGFAAAMTALSQPTDAAQAGGAAALQSFLRAELGADFRDQTFLAVRAQLDSRIMHPDAARAILVLAFVSVLKDRHAIGSNGTPRLNPGADSNGVDLVWIWLQRADLSDMDLESVDLAHADLTYAQLDRSNLMRAMGWRAELSRASLKGANLSEARMHSCRAQHGNFEMATLVAAKLKEANLDGARFKEAKLQSVIFGKASLRKADFRGASVADAHFRGARLDTSALSTLVEAKGIWRYFEDGSGRGQFAADFDPDTAARLLKIARRQGKNWVPA